MAGNLFFLLKLFFQVGANTRGKNEFMAIGGPWSPSLDGADPAGDPNVLIQTAIRTCRALTGVDLTPCTHWYVPFLPFNFTNFMSSCFR